MCGLVGFWQNGGGHEQENIVSAMAEKLTSRGPDDKGVWLNPELGVALAHRRLAILDLTSAGHQPMISESGRYVLVYNGEIYNHLDLRHELEEKGSAPNWRGSCDTETLIAGFEKWGIERTLLRTKGMFAFALWDQSKHSLTLGRDRLGEKPLYYGLINGIFFFASELRALKAHPSFDTEIDRKALNLFMQFGYVPTPYSIYKNIRKLEPGCTINFSSPSDVPETQPYWSAEDIIIQGLRNPFCGTQQEGIDELEKLLLNSVKQQMLADVPLGVFLSGGVDSSLVTCLMEAQTSHPVHTFSIGFHEKEYNEAENSKEVANYLGTKHTEFYITPKDALEAIPKIPSIFSEPFSDSSQIPTYILSKLARQHVVVALSGDGGDELFGGYNRYTSIHKFWKYLSLVPPPARRLLAWIVLSFSPDSYDKMLGSTQNWIPHHMKIKDIGNKLHKSAQAISARTPEEFYSNLIRHWKDGDGLVLGLNTSSTSPSCLKSSIQLPPESYIQNMMANDLVSYLPDDILVKVDRSSMAVGLETRIPMLDHKIVEYACSLPLDLKICNGTGKWILRQVLYKYIPKKLIERPKMGFGVPIGSWLRGPLRNWAEELLSRNRILQDGYFNPDPIQKKWNEHLSGKRDRQQPLWNILMFQAWLDEQTKISN